MSVRTVLKSRPVRLVSRILGILLVLLLVLGAAGLLTLRGSLARLEGQRPLAHLDGPVSVSRDELGVPDIVAASRRDAARALGYVHAQDRFFQMDLMRRAAAGELAALLGPALLDTDRDARRHGFRRRAGRALAALPEADRELLHSYAEGVNAGLAHLRSRPWEYWVLQQQPQPWSPDDTFLVLAAMFLDLSYSTVNFEAHLAQAVHALKPELVPLLLPEGSDWDAPLQQGHTATVVIPDSTNLDVRNWNYGGRTYQQFRAYQDSLLHQDQDLRQDRTGSNNWAVAGRLSAHGGALLANDMHLSLSLPNTWYRARLDWQQDGRRHMVVGVTLPGAPLMVVGSNGHLAWGFTNSYGDWSDLVILDTDPADSTRYRTPGGWERIQQRQEIIAIKGQQPDTLVVRETIWGPVWGHHPDGRLWALRYTAHDPEGLNMNLRLLETAGSVDEAVAVAGTIGIPPQNLVCADAAGRIAWSLAGRVPRRVGWDGRLPVSWADGACRWDGYLDAAEQPRIVDPTEGRLWTANARVVAGNDLALIGDGGYGVGVRAGRIRDDLRALDHPDEADMLAVQLDDRALFLGQWRELLLPVLERHAARQEPEPLLAAFITQVRDHWEGRADPRSVSYQLVRRFMYETIERLYRFLATQVMTAYPDYRDYYLPYRHAVTWEVLNRRPAHLLSPQYDDWDQFMMESVWTVLWRYEQGELKLEEDTWGRRNTLRMGHPFTRLAPWLSRWLAAPAVQLSGDGFMPRVQGPGHGASQRMVVSPGREEQGLFHMPGGQSGHPLSPFFLAGHQDWVDGKAAPLLPGAPRYQLKLLPGGGN